MALTLEFVVSAVFTYGTLRAYYEPSLGHTNFLAEFNVCFYRHELAFEVCPIDK